jgi:membrane-bound inhibitor of C-type lysozyme
MAKYVIAIIFIALLTGASYYAYDTYLLGKGEPLNKVNYVCTDNKTISASYYADSVDVALSDGRTFSLPQVVSGSGSRYATADESVVFWNKGTSAFITEGNPDNQTFMNCGDGAPTAAPMNSFTNASSTFSVQYAPGWTADAAYQYTGVSAAKPISGVRFTIPAAVALGTNLSPESYVSVEMLPRATSCVADIYVLDNVKPETVSMNGKEYSHVVLDKTTAGNRVEEHVYAIPGSSPCTAVRYVIKSSAIDSAATTTVTAYDTTTLMAEFDKVRDSVQLLATTPGATPSATSTQ